MRSYADWDSLKSSRDRKLQSSRYVKRVVSQGKRIKIDFEVEYAQDSAARFHTSFVRLINCTGQKAIKKREETVTATKWGSLPIENSGSGIHRNSA